MEINELIDILKGPAIEVMAEKLVPASALIGISIYTYTENGADVLEDSLLENNNPYMAMNKEKKIVKYDTIKHAMITLTNSVSLKKKKNYTNKEFLLLYDKDHAEEIIGLINGYKLENIDREVYEDIYSDNENIVDIDSEPFIDQYTVKNKEDGKDKEVLKTWDKKEAIEVCKEDPKNNVVVNSQNKIIYGNTPVNSKAKSGILQKDQKLFLHNINIYEKESSISPYRIYNGEVHVITGVIRNNRIQVGVRIEGEYTQKFFVNKTDVE